MSDSTSELYQSVILEHNRAPRNFRCMDDATGSAEGVNPVCGDEVTVFVRVEDGVVSDVSFQGSGCAISRASASLMTQAVRGKSVAEARQLFAGFHELLTGGSEIRADAAEQGRVGHGPLGKLTVLGGVRAFPMRVKCATLAWHALNAALKE
jgi:nitrogen fixation protein NifU and related proteins